MGNIVNFSPSMDRAAAEELVEKYRQLWANEIESGKVQMATVEQFLAKIEEVRVGIDPMKSPIEKMLAIADAEHSYYREQIIRWFIRSTPGWPSIDQLSEEQKDIAELVAIRFERAAKEQGVPLECFTWYLENREAWIPLFMFVLP